MAEQANLTIYQGDDYSADVTVFDADGVTPADLTGYSAQSQIRINYNDTTPNGEAQFLITINSNVITMVLPHDQTAALSKPAYVWDLQVISPIGWITTILSGQVFITKEVTKIYSTPTRRVTLRERSTSSAT
jgi:hypothetical protein